MKVFILPLLAAAVSAQYITPYATGVYPGMVQTPVVGAINPLVGVSPYLYKPAELKPVQTLKYEKLGEDKVEKKEEGLKIETYAQKDIFGNQIVYKQPVLTQKYEVPARFHIKNGKLEHTSFQKREAEADPAMYMTYGNQILPGFTGLTGYTGLNYPAVSAVSPIAPAVIPQASVYAARPVVSHIQTPTVVKSEMEFLKPEVKENAKTVANDAITPYMYAGKFTYKAENLGAVHVAKREAEADPQAILPYGIPSVSTYGRVIPSVYNYGSVVPSIYRQPVVYANPLLKVKSFADDRVKAEKYASKFQYRAETDGSLHLAKREAESDPLTIIPSVYNNFYTRPVVHTNVAGVSPFVNTYANTLGYTNTHFVRPAYTTVF